MADYSVVLQAISTIGFPIVVCLMLMFYIKDTNEKDIEKTEKFTEALNKNTIVLQKICDAIGIERED